MSKNIVFMGSPQFSVPTLKVLAKSLYQIMCVYTQPPKKALRGQNIVQTPIQEVAENLKIGVRSPNDLNDENEFAQKKYTVQRTCCNLNTNKKTIILSYYNNIHYQLVGYFNGKIMKTLFNYISSIGNSRLFIYKSRK